MYLRRKFDVHRGSAVLALQAAFNARDLATLQAPRAPDVDWTNTVTRGRVHGWRRLRLAACTEGVVLAMMRRCDVVIIGRVCM